jgi:D-proline reductase (dithiol) PrdB
MSSFSRIKNQTLAKVSTRFPSAARKVTQILSTLETQDVPWTPLTKPLAECKVAIVTTAGVHHRDQEPFDMHDRDGDSTFRVINASLPVSDLVITHDYYDHADADRDINIIFPIQRLREIESEGLIGEVARYHYAFMGHILGGHIEVLINQTAPKVARRLKSDGVDVVLLTPG